MGIGFKISSSTFDYQQPMAQRFVEMMDGNQSWVAVVPELDWKAKNLGLTPVLKVVRISEINGRARLIFDNWNIRTFPFVVGEVKNQFALNRAIGSFGG